MAARTKPRSTGTKITADDVYADITAKIIAIIESGDMAAWAKCWRSIGYAHHNVVTKHVYTGGNAFILGVMANHLGYEGAEWSTFNGWKSLGAMVRKGEKSVRILKPCPWAKEINGEMKSGVFFTTDSVFHRDQVDNAPPRVDAEPINPDAALPEIDAKFERFLSVAGIKLVEGPNPCYVPSGDWIEMPRFGDFTSGSDHYSTLAHESVHATGRKGRCDRALKGRWEDEASYAGEELVAELGAAFLLARLGIAAEPRPDHAPYLASWLRALKGDTKALFTAATAAKKAVAWILERMDEEAPTGPVTEVHGAITLDDLVSA